MKGTSSRSPTVQRVATVLEERILLGTYAEGHWLPAERDLAQQLGVSREIIRLALDTLETRQLILRAPNCRPLVQKLKASDLYLRTPSRDVLCCIWPDGEELDWAALQKGILSALNTSHYHLIVGQPCTTAAAQRMFLERAFLEQATAGVLLCAADASLSLSFLEALLHRGKPIVFVGLPPPEGMEADLVGTNNKGAASEVVRHLVAQGHRGIAHLTIFDGTAVQERLIGYRQALKEAGIPFRPELVISGAADYQGRILDPGELNHRLLSMPAPPTALFAVNDALAFEAIHTLRASGLRVPEDMAVAGFGGYLQRESDSAFLTTAVQPWERIGQEAAELLMRRIESGTPAHYQRILLDAPLSIHGSTRPLR